MGITRAETTIQDAQGRALAGALVFWCTQPATVPVDPPPNPLATVYTNITGATPETQPIVSDGFGYAFTYLDDSVLYTLMVYHPLFGPNPLAFPDQAYGGGGGGGATITTFAGVPTGTIDGTNTIFTVVNGSTPLTAVPAQITVWLNFSLIQGLGYSLAVVDGQLKVTFAVAPQPAAGGNPADAIFAQGIIVS